MQQDQYIHLCPDKALVRLILSMLINNHNSSSCVVVLLHAAMHMECVCSHHAPELNTLHAPQGYELRHCSWHDGRNFPSDKIQGRKSQLSFCPIVSFYNNLCCDSYCIACSASEIWCHPHPCHFYLHVTHSLHTPALCLWDILVSCDPVPPALLLLPFLFPPLLLPSIRAGACCETGKYFF